MHAIWAAMRRLVVPPLDGADIEPGTQHAGRALEPHNPPAVGATGAPRQKRRQATVRGEWSSREFRRPVDPDERLPVLLVDDGADISYTPTPCGSPRAAQPGSANARASVQAPVLIPITPPSAQIDLPRWRAWTRPSPHAAARAYARPSAYIVRRRGSRIPCEAAASGKQTPSEVAPTAGSVNLVESPEASTDVSPTRPHGKVCARAPLFSIPRSSVPLRCARLTCSLGEVEGEDVAMRTLLELERRSAQGLASGYIIIYALSNGGGVEGRRALSAHEKARLPNPCWRRCFRAQAHVPRTCPTAQTTAQVRTSMQCDWPQCPRLSPVSAQKLPREAPGASRARRSAKRLCPSLAEEGQTISKRLRAAG